MSCGNNCAGCACGSNDSESKPVLTDLQVIAQMKAALEDVVMACTEEHWAKHDIKRIALAGLNGIK